MSVLKTEDLSKNYGKVKALKGVELEVDKGEIVGVLGPNGAGKSTLIKILTSQIERDSGNLEVLGIDPGKEEIRLKEKVGILPEREDPPSFLTGKEYLNMVSDVREEDIDKDRWIETLKLEGKMDSMTRELSKGERQKLMVAQAFFHDPELVFVDEPLINLDPIMQEEVKKLFRGHRDQNKTVFLCTHVVSLAEELCDRVIFLKDGEVIEKVEEVENLKKRFLDKE